jgi:hypothetical protein
MRILLCRLPTVGGCFRQLHVRGVTWTIYASLTGNAHPVAFHQLREAAPIFFSSTEQIAGSPRPICESYIRD